VNVAALQKHLADLAGFLAQADANKAVLNGLFAVQQGLQPFAEYKFEDFAAFLKLASEIADEFRRTGQVPVPPPKKTSTRAPKAPKLSVEDARSRVRALYEQAPRPDFSLEHLERELAELNALSVPNLKEVAAEANAAGRAKSARAKKDIIGTIRTAILDRHGTIERVEQ
jgi:hypothetical protein